MVNIKLNEFDRKILANIKPSDKWSKFKNIFVLNSEIQKLKIGSSKVGTKCSQHLRELSNKNIVTLEEIRDGCKDLIPKKHKHGLAKDKTKRDVLKEHTKLDIGQDKEKEKPKHKKPTTTKKPSPTQQLVNLLTAQQTAVRQQTIASNIAKVDQILTDRNQNLELPDRQLPDRQVVQVVQPTQKPQLQLRTQSLGNQVQDNSANLRMRLLEGSLLDREKGLSAMQRSLERQKQMAKEKLDNASLLESVVEEKERRQRVGSQVVSYVDKERNRYKQLVMDGRMTPSQAQQNIQNLNNLYINHLQNREAEELQSKNILQDIEQLEREKQFRLRNRKAGVDSVLSRLRNRESQEKQDRLVNELIMDQNEKKIEDIQSELLSSVSSRAKQKEIEEIERQKQTENTLENLQLGVMDRTSGLAEQQSIFESNYDNPLRLKRDTSTSAFDVATDKTKLEFKKTPSESDVVSATGLSAEDIKQAQREKKMQEELTGEQIFNRKVREKTRVSRRQKRKEAKKAQELLELQEQEKKTSGLIDRLILETEETNVDVDKFKKEMALRQQVASGSETALEEVAMEEKDTKYPVGSNEPLDKPVKMMSPEDIIGRPKSRYVIQSGLGTPSEVYGNPDSTFYNKNYKDILNQYVTQSRNSPIYNKPMKNNYAQTWDIINKVKNAKVYTADSKTKDLRHRKDYQKDLLKQLHARNVEQLMDRYLLEKDPIEKEYFKYAGIAAEQYFKSENPNEDPQYKLFNKINKRGKGVSISREKFIEESKKLDLDDVDSKKWDSEASRLKEFHEEWDNEMSESAKRSYMAGSRDMFSSGLGQEGFNELPY